MEWIVAKGKDCLGKRSLSRSDTARQDRKQLVGLLTMDPRQVLPEGGQVIGDDVLQPPVPMLGHVTSSYHSACLGRSIALALIKDGRRRVGETVYVSLQGRNVKATVARPIFFDPDGVRQRV
jgi:sarcosine oxidase subunit alpha